MSLIKNPLHIKTPPRLRENFEISEMDILNPPPLLRENVPQIYCLMSKIFLGASPTDPLIYEGSEGLEPLQEKNCKFRGYFRIFLSKKC